MPARISTLLLLLVLGSAARAETLVLANGDSLSGEVVERELDHVVLDHPQLGRIRISLDQLKVEADKPLRPGLFGTGFLRGWRRSIDLGWNGAQGNSEALNLTGGLDFQYDDEFKRWRLNGRYFLARDEDGTSENNATASLRRDWLFPGSRWFAFSQLQYQFDDFESWKHRATASFGPGYNLIRREAHTLDVRLGPTFTREFGERNDDLGEVLFGVDYTWRVTQRLLLTLANGLFTQFQPQAGELRNLSLGELKLEIAEQPALNLKLGASNEFETDVEPGDKKNDLKYWLSLGLDF